MRKLTLDFVPSEDDREALAPLFECIHSYEILETMTIEWEEGLCIDLIECRAREGFPIREAREMGNFEILSVIRSQGDRHICLVKYYEPADSLEQMREFKLDLIYTTPTVVSPERCTTSVIGDRQNLTRFVELVRRSGGDIVNMSFKRAVYQRQDMLSVLTDRQREVMVAAHRFGYYDYPRGISSERLSQRVGVSVPTLVQHLRKAEGRIVAEIMTGYS